ncbi:MAG TPA: hypothetical protein VKT25_01240, partial [Ktedonobacteraceae bacterium]|nr:hypothetical protein [Ktedonobacteraceae bacterium]
MQQPFLRSANCFIRKNLKGDRQGRPYKDYVADSLLNRVFVRATLAVALEKISIVHAHPCKCFHRSCSS